jgi:hypothetical protein
MKGAIQVSIGFLIIMVVSAIVLIFIMSWLGGLFPQLQQISTYATQQAEQEMMNKFAESGDKILATLPYKAKFQPGSEVHYKIGVRKTAEVDDDDYFSLCVGMMDKTTCTTPSGDSPVEVQGDSSGIQFKFATIQKITERGAIARGSAIMVIPSDTPSGIYGFKIYVCSGDSPAGKCNGLKDSYGIFDFIVEVQ